MVLNAKKRNKLDELVARHKASLADAGTSAPVGPSPTAASAPTSPVPALIDNRQKGVVEATASEDEDTYTSLVFKRKRADDVVAPSHSASDGHAPSFRDNPPSTSSPRELIMHEGGGESASEGDQVPLAVELPAFLQQALKCFQKKEAVESLSEDSLQDCVAQSLGEFLIASSLYMSKARDSQAETTKLREELALQAKTFSKRKIALYQELASLWQSKKETKRLLFEKSQEALQSESKILPLLNKVIDLKENVEEALAKMAKLEEKATEQKVQLGQLEGELAQKVKLFKQTEEELINDASDAYGAGFEDAMAQVTCVHPEMDLSPFEVMKHVVDGQLVQR